MIFPATNATPRIRRHADERRHGRTHDLFFFLFSSNCVAHTTNKEGPFMPRCTHPI